MVAAQLALLSQELLVMQVSRAFVLLLVEMEYLKLAMENSAMTETFFLMMDANSVQFLRTGNVIP